MKMMIFLIVLAAVVTAVIMWTRKTDAEKDLARRQAMKRKQEQRKEVITPEEHVKWPVIIKAGGKSVEGEQEKLPEPTMTAIKFKPVDQTTLQH